jgi:hypothetical protein
MNFEEQLALVLNGCDKDQLNKYLNDEESSDLLVKSLDYYQSLVSEKDRLQIENRQIAESNLNKEPILENLKKQLAETINEFEKSKTQYLSLKESIDAQAAVGGDMSLNGILNVLKANAVRAEEDTDKSADDFFCETNGVTHTDEELNIFQKQFLENRTQAHIIKIKAEKMDELLPNKY